MTAPRTAVHPSGARRRPTPAGTRRRKRSGVAARRPSGARKPNRRRVAGRRKAGPARRPSLRDLRRLWPAALLIVAVLAAVAWDTQADRVPPLATAECTLPGASLNLTAEQVTNARTIAQVARDRGLPDRAIVIALATAQQESRLRNLDYGDRDSLGLFQQRPSQGWGTEAQVQDPVYSAGKFYDGLVRVPNWETGRLTESADSVQRSAFPEAYAQWETMATELSAALTSGNLSCS